MSGKQSFVTDLALRKELLIAESELNRVRMLGDMAAIQMGAFVLADRTRNMADAMTVGVRTLAGRVRSFGTVASVAALAITGLKSIWPRKSRRAVAKTSRFQSLLKGAGVISTLWLTLRDQDRAGPGPMEDEEDE